MSENCIKIRWFLPKLQTKTSWLLLWPTVYMLHNAYALHRRHALMISNSKAVATRHKQTSLRVRGDWLPVISNFHKRSKCLIFSATTLAGCGPYFRYYTAGQRIDPSSNSPFIWRPDTLSDTVSLMTYANWDRNQPDSSNPPESCMCLIKNYSYKWHDVHCNLLYCSVCEIDIWVQKQTQFIAVRLSEEHYCEHPRCICVRILQLTIHNTCRW